MIEGTCKFFNYERSFGFIDGDDGESYFVEKSQIPPGVVLYEGARVEFEPYLNPNNPNRLRAAAVKRI